MIGLIGAGLAQTAQAQTISPQEVKPVSAKRKIHKKFVTHAQTSSKKTKLVKREIHLKQRHSHQKNRTKHKIINKSHRYPSESSLNTANKPRREDNIPLSQPSDLWLARDLPEKYKELVNNDQLDEQSLKILDSAYSFLGTPYRWGGTTPNGFDCSGFLKYIFNQNGISLGRTTHVQVREGEHVRLSDLKPGDLVFFKMRRRIRGHYRVNHVGLFVGNAQFIHASSRAREIQVDDLDSDTYFPRIVEARRIIVYQQIDSDSIASSDETEPEHGSTRAIEGSDINATRESWIPQE